VNSRFRKLFDAECIEMRVCKNRNVTCAIVKRFNRTLKCEPYKRFTRNT
jgi:hypothetical protein